MKRNLLASLLLLLPLTAQAKPVEGGGLSPDGKFEVQVDLPADQRQKNIASKGLGCCVFRSLDHASRWQNVAALVSFPEWMVQHGIEGGGFPSKVDKLIPQIAKDRGLPVPEYIQYEGKDPDILKAALATGRMPFVTYDGNDGVHYSGPIAHMVNLELYTGDNAKDWVVVFDNNFVKPESQRVWLRPSEFLERWSGWGVMLLAPPPPPSPPTGPNSAKDELPPDKACPCPFGCTCGCRLGLPCVCGKPARGESLPESWEWRQHPRFPNQYALHIPARGPHVGTWDRDADDYQPYDARTQTWGASCPPPVAPPVPPRWRDSGNFGIDMGKIGKGEAYSYTGRPVTKEQAIAAVAGDKQIPDDSHKLRLTVAGSDAERKAVLDDLAGAPELAPWKSKLLVQDYPPDHWALRPGFAVSGHPTIYVQRPDGAVLHRQDDYAGGAQALALALRKTDPDYKPANDPDRRRLLSGPGLIAGVPREGFIAVGAALAAVGLTLVRRRLGR